MDAIDRGDEIRLLVRRGPDVFVVLRRARVGDPGWELIRRWLREHVRLRAT